VPLLVCCVQNYSHLTHTKAVDNFVFFGYKLRLADHKVYTVVSVHILLARSEKRVVDLLQAESVNVQNPMVLIRPPSVVPEFLPFTHGTIGQNILFNECTKCLCLRFDLARLIKLTLSYPHQCLKELEAVVANLFFTNGCQEESIDVLLLDVFVFHSARYREFGEVEPAYVREVGVRLT